MKLEDIKKMGLNKGDRVELLCPPSRKVIGYYSKTDVEFEFVQGTYKVYLSQEGCGDSCINRPSVSEPIDNIDSITLLERRKAS